MVEPRFRWTFRDGRDPVPAGRRGGGRTTASRARLAGILAARGVVSADGDRGLVRAIRSTASTTRRGCPMPD